MTSDPLDLFCRSLSAHAELGSDDRRAILGLPHGVKALEAHSYTIREGDPPTACAVLLSGFAYRHKLTGEGARQIVALNVAGDILDFQSLFLDVADHNVQMLSRARIALIPREPLQELAQSRAAVGYAILMTTLVEASMFREWLLNVGRRDATTRLAHLLCEVAVRLEGRDLISEYGYELPMTQEQLADALGLTSVHVNRTLKSLEVQGLITRDKRRISFPSWRKMREFADFNERYLHRDFQLAAEGDCVTKEVVSA